MAEGTVFALPPGVDFAQELVRGLIARMEGQPPEATVSVCQSIANVACTVCEVTTPANTTPFVGGTGTPSTSTPAMW